MEKTFIDLFCGIGGFRLAMENNDYHCLWSSDIDEVVRETYRENFGEYPAGDITKIDVRSIPPHEILCAGFPCQPFSISGKQQGFQDVRGTLFFDIARIAEYHQPEVLFLENVAGLLTHDNTNTLTTIIQTLASIGYRAKYQVLNASHYGVPQSRKRIYIIAVRNDIDIARFSFPAPLSIDVALEDFLEPVVEKFVLDRAFVRTHPDQVSRVLKPARIGHLNKGGRACRIYHPKGHAITQMANGGGLGAKTGIYLIDELLRTLSPSESKQVQGFSREHIVTGTINQQLKQCGNSVAVPVIQAIGHNISKLFSGSNDTQNETLF